MLVRIVESVRVWFDLRKKYTVIRLTRILVLGEDGDATYRVLDGTGWRNPASLLSVRAVIGDVEAPVVYAGAQGYYAGLDQLNIFVPGRTLQTWDSRSGGHLWLSV